MMPGITHNSWQAIWVVRMRVPERVERVDGGEGGDDGVGFVGKRVGGVGAAERRRNAVAGEREAVENVAEVHHEPGDGGGQGADAGGDQLHGEKLHRAGVNDHREDGGPPPGEASLGHHQTEGEAEGNES